MSKRPTLRGPTSRMSSERHAVDFAEFRSTIGRDERVTFDR
jgi:hypothetical protein